MKEVRLIFMLVFSSIFLIFGTAQAQKKMKILGVPEKLERPIDVFNDPALVDKMINDARDMDREIRWVVFSDRDDNPVYPKPDNSLPPSSRIGMGEFFYVLDEESDWIQIGKSIGFPDKLKAEIDEASVGWVPKSKMLLWSHGLISATTGINKKAFLLNRGDDEKILESLNRNGDKQVFRDPGRNVAAENVKVYSFFFVFKKEGDMYLLSKEEYLTPSKDSKNTLVGWIHRRDLQEWNTRLSLEPNFSEAAYNERKQNPNLRARSYYDLNGITNVSVSSPGDLNYLFKEDDPAFLKPSEVSEENPKRLKGGVLRYPIFGSLSRGDVKYYKSGAIGNIKVVSNSEGKVSFESEIPENAMAQMSSYADKYIQRSQKVNIFFVIEGTDKTSSFKPGIVAAIESLKSNPLLDEKSDKTVQYGALIYRAPLEGDRVVEIERLGPSLDEVKQFVESKSFTNINNRSDETAVFYGIQQAVLKAGFNPEELNIMVVIGAARDFSRNTGMKDKAKAEGWKEYVEPNELRTLFGDLQNLKMNLHCIQVKSQDLQTYQDFSNDIKGTILKVAQERYNKAQSDDRFRRYMEKNDQLSAEWDSPIFQWNPSSTFSAMEGSTPGIVMKPVDNEGTIKSGELSEGLNFMLDQTLINENAVVELFQLITKEGEELDIERFSEENGLEFSSVTPGFALKMAEMHAALEISEEDMQSLMGKKLNLYTEVYLPVKPEGAKHNTFSQVLFMPFSDLRAYRMDIDRSIEKALNAASDEERREELYNMLVSRTEKLAGETAKKDRDNFSVADIARMEQGIYKEGGDVETIQMETTSGERIKLGDIKSNKGSVKSEDVDALINGFDRIRKTLKDIERDEHYPFQLSTNRDNTYYWIRMDQFFPEIGTTNK